MKCSYTDPDRGVPIILSHPSGMQITVNKNSMVMLLVETTVAIVVAMVVRVYLVGYLMVRAMADKFASFVNAIEGGGLYGHVTFENYLDLLKLVGWNNIMWFTNECTAASVICFVIAILAVYFMDQYEYDNQIPKLLAQGFTPTEANGKRILEKWGYFASSHANNVMPQRQQMNVNVAPIPQVGNSANIFCVKGSYAGQSFPVTREGLIIGRDPSACNVVMQSGMLSRRHASVSLGNTPDTIILSDLGSTNGTFVFTQSGWTKITGATSLTYLKRFRLGSQDVEFEVRS